MKKETINTFDKGMVRDLHPLTTPNNVLTDALNATLITYNGNENILQNDMGNTKVGTAFLPAGYVPVGVKEHGGIVYVAAYNPETDKGLVGSFPSPQQLYKSEDWDVNKHYGVVSNVSFNENDFYASQGSLHINNEIVKQELFKKNDEEAKKFYPGDKFLITCASANTLASYVNNGWIKIQLGVVGSDGSIEIMKEMKDASFFYNGSFDGEIPENLWNVFTASSSGNLILIVTINTIDSFNLLRLYSMNGNSIRVTFTGEAIIVGETIRTNTVTNETAERKKVKLYYNSLENSTVDIDEPLNGSSVDYTITPSLPYGIIDRMLRSGVINFDKIRKNEESFDEWRFYVANDYIKIGWAYESYNLNGESDIKCIKMYFYDFTRISDQGVPLSPVDTIEFHKEYYSGNFEDYIRFDAHPNIKRGEIYVVKIVKVLTNNSETPVAYRMLYVSSLYNTRYNSISELAAGNGVNFSNIGSINIPINLSVSVNSELKNQTYKLETPATTRSNNSVPNLLDKPQLNGNDYIVFPEDVQAVDGTPVHNEFITRIDNSYTCTLKLHADYSIDDKYIGTPSTQAINDVLSDYNIVNTDSATGIYVLSDTTDVQWTGSGVGLSDLTTVAPSVDGSAENGDVVDNTKPIDITIKDSRYIQGRASDVKKTPYKSVAYRPVFLLSMAPESKNRVATFWDMLNMRTISGCKDSGFYYNSLLLGDGSVVHGTDAGAGRDDSGLDACNRLMNATHPPMVTIFSPTGGSYASLRYNNLARKSSDVNGWTCSDGWGFQGEVDNNDNYLITSWKFVDGNSKFINIMTLRHNRGNNLGLTSSDSYPRVDIMLRCLLSQMFIALACTKTKEYVTTRDSQYRHLDGKARVAFTINCNGSLHLNDIMLYNGRSSDTLYTLWESTIPLSLRSGFVNLVPCVNFDITLNQLHIESELESDYNMEQLLSYYTGQLYSLADDMSIDIGALKFPDVDKASQLSGYLKGGIPQVDGTYEWEGDIPDNLLKTLDAGVLNATLFKWTGISSTITVESFADFVTTARYENWDSISEDSINEVLVVDLTSGTYAGEWVENSNQPAPDLHYNIKISGYNIFSARS